MCNYANDTKVCKQGDINNLHHALDFPFKFNKYHNMSIIPLLHHKAQLVTALLWSWLTLLNKHKHVRQIFDKLLLTMKSVRNAKGNEQSNNVCKVSVYYDQGALRFQHVYNIFAKDHFFSNSYIIIAFKIADNVLCTFRILLFYSFLELIPKLRYN